MFVGKRGREQEMRLERQAGTQPEKLVPLCTYCPARVTEYQMEKVICVPPEVTTATSSSRTNPLEKTKLLLFDGNMEKVHGACCSHLAITGYLVKLIFLRKRYKHNHSQRHRLLGQTIIPTSEDSSS